MQSITQDVRYAARKLIQRPGFTVAAVLILALGVGANTTIFSIVNTVLLSPLPYDRSNDLVVVKESNPTKSIEQNDVSPGSFLDLREQTSIFASVTAWYQTAAALHGEQGAEQIAAAQVSTDFFNVFNVQPAVGRVFLPNETAGAAFENSRFVSGDRVVVISDGLWRRRFGSDANIVGRKITINRNEWEVLGVMPADFDVTEKDTELWLPWDIARTYSSSRFPQGPPRDWRFMNVVGRLNPAISRDEAQSRLSTFYSSLAERYPDTNQNWNAVTIPLYEETVQSSRLILLVLLGAVGMVLLLASANIAGLVLANAAGRQREFALKLALGASRFRLVRQLLAESLLLATAGGLIGVGVSWIGLDVLLSLAPPDLPRISEVVIDWRVLLFAFGLSLTAAIVFGLLPALRSTGAALSLNLRDGGTKGLGGRLPNRRFRNAMVISQVSVALVLITCAGLLVRSFNYIVSVNPGFESSNLLTMHITLDGAVYGRNAGDYYRELIKRLESMPAVVSAAAVSTLPMSDVGVDFTRPYWRAGEAEPSGDGDKIAVRMATPEYFKTMGITLLQGRYFSDQDRRDTTAVILVNKSMADKTWPNESPIGKLLMLDYNRGKYAYEVVGVTEGLRYYGLKKDPAPELFIPHAQNAYLPMNVVVKTKSDPNRLVEAIKREVSALDPTQPVSNVRTMEQLVQRSYAKDRFSASLLTVLASLALVLAATGLYSLLSYFVSQRRHELAVRVAVGAQRRDIVRLVLGQGALVVAAGIALGLLGSFIAGRFLSSLLFGVGPTDSLTFVSTPLLLALVALLACYVPAWRATTVDPLTALRSE
jgi:putative ABC transport system permease protein